MIEFEPSLLYNFKKKSTIILNNMNVNALVKLLELSKIKIVTIDQKINSVNSSSNIERFQTEKKLGVLT